MTEHNETPARLEFDLAVIGAGPGGYATALRAAQLGRSVALIERDATLGGTCLNRGCIPSKALITASHTIDTAHRASELGVNTTVEGIDYARLRDWRLHVVDTMTKGLAGLVAHRGIVVFRAEAALAAEAGGTPDSTGDAADARREVVLSPAPGQTQVLRYDKAEEPQPEAANLTIAARDVVLAMGARPRRADRFHAGAGTGRVPFKRGGDRRRRCGNRVRIHVERGRRRRDAADSQGPCVVRLGQARRRNTHP